MKLHWALWGLNLPLESELYDLLAIDLILQKQREQEYPYIFRSPLWFTSSFPHTLTTSSFILALSCQHESLYPLDVPRPCPPVSRREISLSGMTHLWRCSDLPWHNCGIAGSPLRIQSAVVSGIPWGLLSGFSSQASCILPLRPHCAGKSLPTICRQTGYFQWEWSHCCRNILHCPHSFCQTCVPEFILF